ncbi:putative holin [Desulfovibrio cuneatus]|uniref:putative holin n=1 Tax=Desulfovibrio cuneatus TaxID=159728 RepID=UPI0004003E3B|nr:putative holin [Desulfovibrio cuneatus]
MQNPFLSSRWQPLVCLALALGLFVLLALAGPQQLPVLVYKLLLPLLGGAVLLFVWVALVPHANPARYLADDWRCTPDADNHDGADFPVAAGYKGVFCACVLGCALVFCAGALAVSLGL